MIRKISLLLLGILFTNAYSQQVKKDTTLRMYRQWTIDRFGDSTDVPLDTALRFFENYNPVFQKSVSSTWLGFTGAPAINNDFWNRAAYENFIFNMPLSYYSKDYRNTAFVNTRKPFSLFNYVMNSNKQMREEVLHFSFTQNVNKDINIGFNIDIYSTNGQYANQKSGNHILSLFSSCNKKRYFYYFTTNFNNFKRQENGGLRDVDTLEHIETGSLSVPTNLLTGQKVSSRNQIFNIYFINGYKFPSLVQKLKKDTSAAANSLNYALEYMFTKRIYTDAISGDPLNYYQSAGISGVTDSTRSHLIRNEAQLILGNFLYLFRLRVSGIYEIQTFKNFANSIPNDSSVYWANYLSSLTANTSPYQSMYSADIIHNGSVYLSLSNSYKSLLNWNFSGQNYLFGYQAGDIKYSGNISLRLTQKNDRLVGSLDLQNNTPAYQLQHFMSTRYRWNNEFSKTKLFHLSGGLISEAWQGKLIVHFGTIGGMVYFNDQALPDQTQVPVNIFSLSGEKFIKFWKFRSKTRALFQLNDREDVVHLPKFAVFETFFFEHLFRFKVTQGSLLFQTGVDLYFNDSFYADTYNPATGMFYLQNVRQIKRYPFLDWFVNIKIQRASVFLKLDHALYSLMGYDYLTAYPYALGPRAFKIGIRWTFYD